MSALREMIVKIAFDVNTSVLDDLNKQVDDFQKNIGGGITEMDELTASTVELDSAVGDLGNTTQSATTSMLDKFDSLGHGMQDVGKKMSLGITAPLAGIAGGAIKAVSSFDDSMSKVQAISGSTGDEFDSLRDKALELSSVTAHSASDVAEAMSYQALAGWEANEILEATPGLLSLASAGQMDLASTADILTDQMAAFGIAADDANMAADMFAQTQASANADIAQLGEALSYAGGAASAAGMDLAETNAVLGILANQSIKGSSGGTTMVSMLNDMKKSAEDGAIAIGDTSIAIYDAEGNMRDLGTIMGDVESATEGMTGAQRDAALGAIWGVEAMRVSMPC